MKIQRGTITDLDAVTALVRDVAEHDILPELNEKGQQEFRQHVLPTLDETLNQPQYRAFVAYDAESLIGFAVLRDSDYLTHLFVAKSAQGTGLGAKLLNTVMAIAEADEIRLRSSVNAAGFYRRHGFVDTGPETEMNGLRFVPMRRVRAL